MADYTQLMNLEKKGKGQLPSSQVQKNTSQQKPTTPPKEPTKNIPKALTNEKTVKRTDERLNERTKIRHTFDILADQLLSLREIALEREKLFGSRVLIGDLVQEALDMFITKERNKE